MRWKRGDVVWRACINTDGAVEPSSAVVVRAGAVELGVKYNAADPHRAWGWRSRFQPGEVHASARAAVGALGSELAGRRAALRGQVETLDREIAAVSAFLPTVE